MFFCKMVGPHPFCLIFVRQYTPTSVFFSFSSILGLHSAVNYRIRTVGNSTIELLPTRVKINIKEDHVSMNITMCIFKDIMH